MRSPDFRDPLIAVGALDWRLIFDLEQLHVVSAGGDGQPYLAALLTSDNCDQSQIPQYPPHAHPHPTPHKTLSVWPSDNLTTGSLHSHEKCLVRHLKSVDISKTASLDGNFGCHVIIDTVVLGKLLKKNN